MPADCILHQATLPLSKLHALWAKLDENGSGFVDAGELGRFMRLGLPEASAGSRTRTLLEKRAGRKALLAELADRSGEAAIDYH